jgi:hypothetical protein
MNSIDVYDLYGKEVQMLDWGLAATLVGWEYSVLSDSLQGQHAGTYRILWNNKEFLL